VKTNIVLPDIPESEVTPRVKSLLLIIEQLLVQSQQQAEEIERLKDEINILKGQQKRPVFEGSKLDKKISAKNAAAKRKKKRPGSKKKKKTQKLVVHEDKVIQPDVPTPEGSRFKGYRYFTVQDLHISVHTTRYCLERWVTPDNKTLTGQLPTPLDNRHFGPQLVSYILYQHHHCQTTQPLLLEQLREWALNYRRDKSTICCCQVKTGSIVRKTPYCRQGWPFPRILPSMIAVHVIKGRMAM